MVEADIIFLFVDEHNVLFHLRMEDELAHLGKLTLYLSYVGVHEFRNKKWTNFTDMRDDNIRTQYEKNFKYNINGIAATILAVWFISFVGIGETNYFSLSHIRNHKVDTLMSSLPFFTWICTIYQAEYYDSFNV